MKKIFITLIALISFNSFANDYGVRVYKCNLSADYSSVSSPKKKNLSSIDFKVVITFTTDKNDNIQNVVKTSISTDILQAPKVRHSRRIYGDEGIKISHNFILKFQDLDSEESVELLKKLGSEIEELPYGFSFKKLNFNKYSYTSTRSQIHYPINTNDGLSFHATISCDE